MCRAAVRVSSGFRLRRGHESLVVCIEEVKPIDAGRPVVMLYRELCFVRKLVYCETYSSVAVYDGALCYLCVLCP